MLNIRFYFKMSRQVTTSLDAGPEWQNKNGIILCCLRKSFHFLCTIYTTHFKKTFGVFFGFCVGQVSLPALSCVWMKERNMWGTWVKCTTFRTLSPFLALGLVSALRHASTNTFVAPSLYFLAMVLGVIPSQTSTITFVFWEIVEVSFTFLLFSIYHSSFLISTCIQIHINLLFYLFLSFSLSFYVFILAVYRKEHQAKCLRSPPSWTISQEELSIFYKPVFCHLDKTYCRIPLANCPLVTWPSLQNSYSKVNRITSRVMDRSYISLVVC